MNGRERGCLQVVSCSVLRLVNMSTRAMRLKTQARALACLQVVYLTLSVVKEQSLSASLVRLEKELFPLYLRVSPRRRTRTLVFTRHEQFCSSIDLLLIVQDKNGLVVVYLFGLHILISQDNNGLV